MSHEFDEIERLVTHFITNTRALNQCMQVDQQYFSSQNLAALSESNLKKIQINERLNECLDELLNHSALSISYGDLFVKLSYYAGTLDSHRQFLLLDLIQEMREEYKRGIQLTHLNRQVVHTNLGYVKELYSYLTQSPHTKETTYDQTGSMT